MQRRRMTSIMFEKKIEMQKINSQRQRKNIDPRKNWLRSYVRIRVFQQNQQQLLPKIC